MKLSWDLYLIVIVNVEVNEKSSLRCIFKQRREFSVFYRPLSNETKTQNNWYYNKEKRHKISTEIEEKLIVNQLWNINN